MPEVISIFNLFIVLESILFILFMGLLVYRAISFL